MRQPVKQRFDCIEKPQILSSPNLLAFYAVSDSICQPHENYYTPGHCGHRCLYRRHLRHLSRGAAERKEVQQVAATASNLLGTLRQRRPVSANVPLRFFGLDGGDQLEGGDHGFQLSQPRRLWVRLALGFEGWSFVA